MRFILLYSLGQDPNGHNIASQEKQKNQLGGGAVSRVMVMCVVSSFTPTLEFVVVSLTLSNVSSFILDIEINIVKLKYP